jgi:hypothetical protein
MPVWGAHPSEADRRVPKKMSIKGKKGAKFFP